MRQKVRDRVGGLRMGALTEVKTLARWFKFEAYQLEGKPPGHNSSFAQLRPKKNTRKPPDVSEYLPSFHEDVLPASED